MELLSVIITFMLNVGMHIIITLSYEFFHIKETNDYQRNWLLFHFLFINWMYRIHLNLKKNSSESWTQGELMAIFHCNRIWWELCQTCTLLSFKRKSMILVVFGSFWFIVGVGFIQMKNTATITSLQFDTETLLNALDELFWTALGKVIWKQESNIHRPIKPYAKTCLINS